MEVHDPVAVAEVAVLIHLIILCKDKQLHTDQMSTAIRCGAANGVSNQTTELNCARWWRRAAQHLEDHQEGGVEGASGP